MHGILNFLANLIWCFTYLTWKVSNVRFFSMGKELSLLEALSWNEFQNKIHFFLYNNIFYKNIEAEICEILRIF